MFADANTNKLKIDLVSQSVLRYSSRDCCGTAAVEGVEGTETVVRYLVAANWLGVVGYLLWSSRTKRNHEPPAVLGRSLLTSLTVLPSIISSRGHL